MASSSSTNYSYDVFLSFRGTDTRNNFTSHLHEALSRKNVKAFIDNINIERGKEITPFLEQIIEGAKLSIIVFSSDYASSTFCLDEMLKIMECKETKAQIVLPIFYKIYPSEEMYTKAFATHEHTVKLEVAVERLKAYFWRALHWMSFSFAFQRHESQEMIERSTSSYQRVERWRSSFQKALELAGWHIDDNRNEALVIDEITRDVLKRLNCLLKGEMKISTMIGETSEYYLEKIMECLMNDENSKVGVWGMGGVGKTTIVKHIYNKLLHDATFSPHIYWVTVSKDSSISKLQHDIAKVIQLDLCGEDNEDKIAIMLFNELKRINKFVLILDDIWEPFEIEDEVGIPLMGGRKLLLTTRDLRVCERMRCEPIKVKPLFKHEAMDLFMKESQCQINDSYEGRKIIQSIVEECEGLPLAVVVVAGTMRGVVQIWKWRDILRDLQRHCEGGNFEIEEKVLKILKFSYDRLSDDRNRQCFLYCSLFPEDHLFKRRYLIEYLIGAGLIVEGDDRQAALDKGNVIVDELLHSSLLNDDVLYGLDYKSNSSIKMHDVIRDMARIMVKAGLQFQDPLESVQVVSETELKNISNLALDCCKLKTLVLRGPFIKQFPDFAYFTNMQNLNVLHISNMNAIFTSLPDFITKLRNLRRLIIDWSDYLERIPSFVRLKKLEYLEISWNMSLKEIPKGIDRLVNLRVLDLSNNSSLRGSFPIGVLRKLSHLQTLNLSGSDIEVEAKELITLEKLQTLMVVFYNLHNFKFYMKSKHWQRLLDYQINYGRCYEDEYENGKKKRMCLSAISDVSDIILTNDLGHLELNDWEKSPLFNLLKNSTFADLQTLVISRYKSSYLFTVDLAQQLLRNVQEFRLYNCSGLKEIISGRGEEEEEWVKSSNYPTIWFPKLKTLELSLLPNLESIYRGKMACPCLEIIEIDYHDKIERLLVCLNKEGRKQNPTIRIKGLVSGKSQLNSWCYSLQWDDANAKSI